MRFNQSKASAKCVLVGLMLALASCLTGCSTVKPRESDSASLAGRAAILDVVKQMDAAAQKFTNTVDQLMHKPTMKAVVSGVGYVVQDFADNLCAIDISKCPEDFRIVFTKYYLAVLDMKKYADANTGWRQFLKGVTAFFTKDPRVLTGLPDRTDQAVNPLEQAGKDLVVILAKYNITQEP